MKPSLNILPASTLAEMIRAGETNARQVVEAFFAHRGKQNPTYTAIVTLHEAEALAQADQADHAKRDGKPCDPLHGVPITIKDTYRVKGSRTTAPGISVTHATWDLADALIQLQNVLLQRSRVVSRKKLPRPERRLLRQRLRELRVPRTAGLGDVSVYPF